MGGSDLSVVSAQGEQTSTPVMLVPTPAAIAERDKDNTVSVLLVGSDTTNPVNAGRTDTLMLVLVQRDSGAVNLLSIPRDLFVYIPGYGMDRINTAFGLGEHSDLADGGYGLLNDVLIYNLGLSFDFYARVDFNGFQSLIDAIGGIDIAVDCALQDWQLLSPELDPHDEANWVLATLPVGFQHLNGYEALWYARSRRTSSDFDRGRRQQEIVRAIWRRVNELGLLGQVATLWHELMGIVETDMGVGDVIGLVPLAIDLDISRIRAFRFEPETHVRAWRTPGGAAVQVPDGAMIAELVRHFLHPVTDNLLVSGGSLVEIENRSGHLNMEVVAASMLNWQGFSTVTVNEASAQYTAFTQIYDYTGRQKGGQLEELLEVLQMPLTRVVVTPSSNASVDYRVVLGGDFRSCQHNVLPPVPVPSSEE